MTPRISIVFTSFNHREFLPQALDSLLNQTFRDFELIVVDDCSTDGSQRILEEYAARDTRIRLFLNDRNSGSYVHSTNLGATKATAPYIIFAQCDDYAEPTQLEKLYTAMTGHPDVGVVFSASRMVDQNGASLGEDFDVREQEFKRYCATDVLIPKKQMSRFLLYSCVIPNLSAALVRRELFELQGGLNTSYFVLADWDFWLKTSLECDFYYLREPLNNFRQHDTTIRASVKFKRQMQEVFTMYYDFFRSARMGFGQSLRWKNNIARIWCCSVRRGTAAWFASLWPLLRLSAKYDFYFPLIAGLNFLFYLPYRMIKKLMN